MRMAPLVELTEAEQGTLAKWSRGRSTPARFILRAKIILPGWVALQKELLSWVPCPRLRGHALIVTGW
ncbi:hypothetical protein AB1L42_14090 [Thalassoglobus sp. JC818]|uniref:hypothetical protein n=1 Tax=Thalassoglobus sp. JC818 TaxID=3232136 RepID=UPI00345AFA5A